ncbi:hypothetical protein NDU88_002122 [Pleurodeles waltl]|uniref:Uncharacterized protein n=1 Tax=Pleurodeles waltl TaxID=8319 RepID=A0AAV7MUR6_PLEWA|nr:hypothetical protein NDU88_002122 [Pleurodeles waltl]
MPGSPGDRVACLSQLRCVEAGGERESRQYITWHEKQTGTEPREVGVNGEPKRQRSAWACGTEEASCAKPQHYSHRTQRQMCVHLREAQSVLGHQPRLHKPIGAIYTNHRPPATVQSQAPATVSHS